MLSLLLLINPSPINSSESNENSIQPIQSIQFNQSIILKPNDKSVIMVGGGYSYVIIN